MQTYSDLLTETCLPSTWADKLVACFSFQFVNCGSLSAFVAVVWHALLWQSLRPATVQSSMGYERAPKHLVCNSVPALKRSL